MTSVTLASQYARRLVDGEAKRSGSGVDSAIRSVARRLRHPPGSVWALLFRAPKRLSADLLRALEAAVERELEREIASLETELARLRASRRGPDLGTIEEVEAGLIRLRSILSGESSGIS